LSRGTRTRGVHEALSVRSLSVGRLSPVCDPPLCIVLYYRTLHVHEIKDERLADAMAGYLPIADARALASSSNSSSRGTHCPLPTGRK